MPLRICADCARAGQPPLFDAATAPGQRCRAHQAAADARQLARRGTTTQRGYGPPHRELRAQLLARWTPGQPCAHCHHPMTDPASLDLAHTPGRDGYRGLAHAACNRGNR